MAINPEAPQRPSIILKGPDGKPLRGRDGKILYDVKVALEVYGLQKGDLNKDIAYEGHKGTVGEMLDDRRCPVGKMAADRYKVEGIAGTDAVLQAAGSMVGKELRVSDETHEYHRREAQKKNPEQPELRDTSATTQTTSIETTSQEVSQPQETTQPISQFVGMPVDSIHTRIVEPIKADLPVEKVAVPPFVEQIKPVEQPTVVVPKNIVVLPIIPHLAPESIVSPVPLATQESREKTVTKTPAVEVKTTSPKKDMEVSEPARRMITNQEVKHVQPSPAAKDQAPVTKPIESMTKEEAAATVIASIDVLLSKDLPDTPESEKSMVTMVQKEGMITLGVVMKAENNTPHGENQAEPQLKPISTADELIQMLDILNQLSMKDIFTPRARLNIDNLKSAEHANKTKAHGGMTERRDHVEKDSHLSLLVSEDVLQFLENGKALFEKLNKKEQPEEPAIPEEARQLQNPVRVMSEGKEMLIELETLKKLIELVKVRKQMKEGTFKLENGTILEELGLHGIDYQNYDDDRLLWYIYETKVRPLAVADDTKLSSYSSYSIFPQVRAAQ